MQPRPEDYDYDLDEALSAVVGLRTIVPSDAFSAETLGTERSGSGVIIGKDGLVLTIGYLVVEAETVWITLGDGRTLPGHVLAYDHETGFGLVQALVRMELPWLELGSSSDAIVGDDVVIAGVGGRRNAVATRVVAKQEFAGYWEYLLEQALFTAPAHPNWGGTALIGPTGELIGIGSLQLQHSRADGGTEDLNMIVPIDLLKPILKSLRTTGRAGRPPRPWLGFYATELEDKLVVAGLSNRGPARAGDLRGGDILLAVDGEEVTSLADLFRKIWSLGPAGVEVPLLVFRDGKNSRPAHQIRRSQPVPARTHVALTSPPDPVLDPVSPPAAGLAAGPTAGSAPDKCRASRPAASQERHGLVISTHTGETVVRGTGDPTLSDTDPIVLRPWPAGGRRDTVHETGPSHGPSGQTSTGPIVVTGPRPHGAASGPQTVRFTRQELSDILNVYGRMVAAGEWRDYAIDMGRETASFSVYRRSSEYALYRIVKNPKLARKQGAYSVVAATGLILKRGPDLRRVLAVFDKRPSLVEA